MQLTNLQVLNALQSLSTIGQHKLPIRLAWRITTAIRSLEPFAKAVDEPMKDIRMKYAIKDQLDNYIEAVDDNGNAVPNTIQIPNDKIAIVNKDMDELLSQMVEVLNVKFKLSEFPDTLELQPAVLVGLTPLITEDEPTELSLVK
jgi:hypothetical protein